MSDPVLDFIKSKNEERERQKEPYDPIIGYRDMLDKVSGADTMPGGPEFANEFENIRPANAADSIRQSYRKSLKTFAADMEYMKGATLALFGNEEGAYNAVMAGVKEADEASKQVGAIDSAEAWEEFLDEPDFEGFMQWAPAVVGETGLSALTSITGALLGVGLAGLSAPVSVPTGTAAVLAGAAGKKKLKDITEKLAFTHFTKDIISDAVQRAALKKTLTNEQKDVMRAVYGQYQKKVLAKRRFIGSGAGVTASEFPRQTGQAFSNYADQGMYDPISAALSFGQGTATAAIGGFTEALVFNKLFGAFTKATGFKSGITRPGRLDNPNKPGSIPYGDISKTIGISTVAEAGTEALQQGVDSLQQFGMLDPRIEGQLNEKYTAQQARLDAQLAAASGALAGLTFGLGGGISTGAVTGAQNLLRDYQQRDAMAGMIQKKYGPGGQGVQIEPKEWIRGQFNAMFDPEADKDAVWVDVNSLEELEKYKKEYPGVANSMFSYDMSDTKTQLGGILFSTDSQIIEGFKQVMENNMPSTNLLDNELARILKYPRTRQNSDAWVAQVRDKDTGALVHYHQTGDPKEDGGVHFEAVKKMFPNSDKYSYEIVDAETHLDERASLVETPGVDLDNITAKNISILTQEQADEIMGRTSTADPEGMTGLRDETGKYAQVADVAEDGVDVTPTLQEGSKPIVDRNGNPWRAPNLQFRDDQVPNDEQVKNARLLTHPKFRQEFDNAIKENKYSRLLLKKFIEQVNKFGAVDTDNNTELVYKIDEQADGFVINKYDKPLEKLQSYEQAKPEFDRIIVEAKSKGRKKRNKVFSDGSEKEVFMNSPFELTSRDPDGNFTLPQTIDMPTLVNGYRKILGRMAALPNEQYYQSLADTFTSVYGSLVDDPDYQLTFKGEPITDQSFNDPDFVVYTEDKGKREFSFADLVARGAEESLGISDQQAPNTVLNIEKKIKDISTQIDSLEEQIKEMQTIRDQQGKFNNEQYNAFMELVESLYGPKKGEKRNTAANLYIQRNDLEQSLREAETAGGSTSLDPRADIEDITVDDGGDFQNQDSTNEYWDEQFEHYQKQGFTRSKINSKKETKPEEEPKMPKETEAIILSEELEKSTDLDVKSYMRDIAKLAKKHLNLKRPILLYTSQEKLTVRGAAKVLPRIKKIITDHGDGNFEAGLKDIDNTLNNVKTEAMDDISGIAGYMQGIGKQFDIIVLKTPTDMSDFDFGLLHLVLGHELGHSFFKEQMVKILKNPVIRNMFMKEFEKAKEQQIKEGFAGGQYFEENGFEEWFVDKVSAGLFDLEKGTIPNSKNLTDNYINTMVDSLLAFYIAKADTQSKIIPGKNMVAPYMQGRFTYDETVGDFMKGIAGIIEERTDLNFQDRAHAEQLIDDLFGSKMSTKFLRRINKDADRMIKTGKVPMWLTKFFFTARGFLDTLGKDQETGKELGQMFHKVSGEKGTPGLINESNRKLNQLVNDLVNRLDMDGKDVEGFDAIKQAVTGINDNAFTQEEIDAFREAQDEKIVTEALSPKAQVVRKFLFDVYDILELEQYEIFKRDPKTGQFYKSDIKRRANYFPRIILVADIAANPKLKAKLIELLLEANPTSKPADVAKAVEAIITNNEKNVDTASNLDKDSGYGLGMPEERAILWEGLDTPTLVKEGLAAPGEVAIIEYLRDITRQVELQKRGGSRRIKQLIDMLPEEEQGHARDAVNAMLGRIDPIRHTAWRHINDGMLTLNVITLLGMAVFASVPDSAGPILRSRALDLKSIVNNITAAMGKGEGEKLARDIGSNGREAMAHTILYAGELDGSALWARKATNSWFRFTQLERWTVFTRKFAAGMARDFLLKHAEIVDKGYEGDADVLLSERYLADLGVTGQQINAYKNGGSNIEAHPEVAAALGRFVDESIVRPNAAERPIWASDPHWAIVWQLKSFYYAYGKNIMGGLFREGNTRYKETGNITPALMPLFFGAALLMPLTMIGWDIRERFKIGLSYALPGVSPNDPGVNYRASKDMSGGKYWFEVLDRSGMMGAPALALPLIMEDKQYGKGPLIPILGPGAERVYDAISGEASPLDYAPIYSQLDTRALER